MPSPLRADPDLAAAARALVQAGLFERRPAYYLRKVAEIAAIGALGFGVGVVFPSLLGLVAAALVLALALTQLAYIGHDAGHHQVFRLRRNNERLGLVIINFFLGLSYGWWVDKHDRHHAHPNELDQDPDIEFPLMIFDARQLAGRHAAWQRFFIRHQAWFFLPLLTLLPLSMRRDSWQFLWREKPPRRRAEFLLAAAHLAVFGTAIFATLGLGRGLIFLVVHQAAFGMLLGTAFAANHKGMPVLPATEGKSFLWRQTITTRNLRAHPLTGFWYGGLDCQIEHHLFPMLPRRNLRQATAAIRELCAKRGVPYHESSVAQSYAEILHHLHTVSAPLRGETQKEH